MTDFNQPTLTSPKDDVLDILNAKIAAVAALDYSTNTNIPSNAVRYENGDFERWNGASWDVLSVSNVADGAITNSKIAVDAITSDKLLFANDGYLRSHTTQGVRVNLLGLNGANELALYGYNANGAVVHVNGTRKLALGDHILPLSGVQNIGSATNYFGDGYLTSLNVAAAIKGSLGATNALVFDSPHASGKVHQRINGADKLLLDATSLTPATNRGLNLGAGNLGFNQVWARSLISYGSDPLDIQAGENINFAPLSTLSFFMDGQGFNPLTTHSRDLGKSNLRFSTVHTLNVGAPTHEAHLYGHTLQSSGDVNVRPGNHFHLLIQDVLTWGYGIGDYWEGQRPYMFVSEPATFYWADDWRVDQVNRQSQRYIRINIGNVSYAIKCSQIVHMAP